MSVGNISRYIIPKGIDYRFNTFMERDAKLRAYRDSGFRDKELRRQVVEAALDPKHYNSITLVSALRDIHILTTPWLPVSFEAVSERFITAHLTSVIEAAIGHVFESGWGKREGGNRMSDLARMAGHPNIEMGERQELLSSFGLNPYRIPPRNFWNTNPEWFFGTYHNEIEGMMREVAVKICERFKNDPEDRSRLLSLSLIAKTSFKQELRALIPQDVLPDEILANAQKMADPLTESPSPWIRSAYHFTKRDLFGNILKYGLDTDHFPDGSEQPDIVCFNNFQNSGVAEMMLGFSGYYVRDILLRVPLESVGAGHKPFSQELGDYSADYQAKKVPVEKISVVDPFNSTRAVPLSDFRSPG